MSTTSNHSAKSQLKTVIITGGASGIGYASAKMLLEHSDYRLVLLGRDQDKLESAAKTLSGGSHDRVSAVTCDVSNAEEITRAIDKVAATHKSIYGLVNNAGVYPFGGLADTTEKSWDETMAVNVKGPMLLIQAVAPYMAGRKDGGRIINVSSTAGLLPNHFALAYSVSKAALVQLTRTLAKELGKDSITVNCVCPGIVRSPMHEAYHANTSELEGFYSKRGAAFPLGRVGEPEDVASVIRFFLSAEASWITADVFVADGGRLLL